MDAVGVTVLSESQRLGDLASTLVLGDLAEDARAGLPGKSVAMRVGDLLARGPESIDRYDLVVCVAGGDRSELERRTLGHAIADVALKAVVSVESLGRELPIPLIELKRGLLLDSPELGYRVYGNRWGKP
ncbi:hypothetical protein [Leucobacter sp. W1478]|uniref:hypothetical protein n=1 Tax=Leucobacter sp. W1478 TaxID=3439065 RepID=UPI003F3A7CE2